MTVVSFRTATVARRCRRAFWRATDSTAGRAGALREREAGRSGLLGFFFVDAIARGGARHVPRDAWSLTRAEALAASVLTGRAPPRRQVDRVA
jgi:hypothetical protein